MPKTWPETLPVAQVRIARPTDQLQEVERFYCEGVGLEKLGSFEGHKGYDGIMLGLPGFSHHLEFTQHEHGSPCPAPSLDNLLVLYLPDRTGIEKVVKRLEKMGYPEVVPDNPYWKEKGSCYHSRPRWLAVGFDAYCRYKLKEATLRVASFSLYNPYSLSIGCSSGLCSRAQSRISCLNSCNNVLLRSLPYQLCSCSANSL